MPDGRSCFWVAKITAADDARVSGPAPETAVGLGLRYLAPINSSTPPASSWTTRARKVRSGRAARSATERRAPSVDSYLGGRVAVDEREQQLALFVDRAIGDRPTPQQTTGSPLYYCGFQQALGKSTLLSVPA